MDARDAGSRTTVGLGTLVRIRLPASPASGEAWTLAPGVPAFLCIESDPGGDGFRAAHPGDTVDAWTFRAQRAGQGALRFRMGRHWSPALGDERTVAFEIRVSP